MITHQFLYRAHDIKWHEVLIGSGMKKQFIIAALLGFMTLSLTSCDLAVDIFQSGMFWGAFLVLLIIFLIFYFLNKAKKP